MLGPISYTTPINPHSLRVQRICTWPRCIQVARAARLPASGVYQPRGSGRRLDAGARATRGQPVSWHGRESGQRRAAGGQITSLVCCTGTCGAWHLRWRRSRWRHRVIITVRSADLQDLGDRDLGEISGDLGRSAEVEHDGRRLDVVAVACLEENAVEGHEGWRGDLGICKMRISVSCVR